MRADASFRVAEARLAPVESGLQPGVGEQRALERGLCGDRRGQVDRMASLLRLGDWDIPIGSVVPLPIVVIFMSARSFCSSSFAG